MAHARSTSVALLPVVCIVDVILACDTINLTKHALPGLLYTYCSVPAVDRPRVTRGLSVNRRSVVVLIVPEASTNHTSEMSQTEIHWPHSNATPVLRKIRCLLQYGDQCPTFDITAV